MEGELGECKAPFEPSCRVCLIFPRLLSAAAAAGPGLPPARLTHGNARRVRQRPERLAKSVKDFGKEERKTEEIERAHSMR